MAFGPGGDRRIALDPVSDHGHTPDRPSGSGIVHPSCLNSILPWAWGLASERRGPGVARPLGPPSAPLPEGAAHAVGRRRGLEMDCDLRVLGAGADPRDYGRLLLAVGGRSGGAAWTALPLSEGASRLKGRPRAMVAAPPSNRLVRAAAFAVLALGAGALACETSPPGPDAAGQAARGVVQAMEFSPALNRDQPRAVWVQQSIRFRAEEEATEDRPRTE